MTNALQARVPRQPFDDVALRRHIEYLRVAMQQTGELFWILLLNQIILTDSGDHHVEGRDVLQTVIDKCRLLQDNIRLSIEVTLQFVEHQRSRLESQFFD